MKYSNIHKLPHTKLTFEKTVDVENFLKFLEGPAVEEYIIIGRVGNITVLNWPAVVNKIVVPSGVLKIQLGKVPSELYCMKKGKMIGIARSLLKKKEPAGTDLMQQLFDSVLFYSFERIVDHPGYSFLMRNSYEYFKENLKVIRYVTETRFIELYNKLRVSSPTTTVVDPSGVIKNSLLGYGARIMGRVEDSVIFSGVTVKKNAVVKNSIVLPSNTVGEDAHIENAIIIGGENTIIGRGCVIGNHAGAKNEHFPHIMREGLTIIGESLTVPEGSRIGAGCLIIGPGREIRSPLVVDDGKTLQIG
jgi:NDP-sugar pyrophosphorylase family protein